MLAAPLMWLSGYLLEAAIRRGDAPTVKTGGKAVIGIAVAGATVIPRSGFPAALPIGYWTMRRARQLGGQDSG